MSCNCAAWVDMITHLHNTGFQERNLRSVFSARGSPPHSSFAGLGVSNGHKALPPALDPLILPGPLLSAGLCSLPLVPAALSLNLLHPQSTTWTSREPELEWVRACSILGIVNVACYHPCSLKVQPLPKKNRAEAHSSRSSMANCHMPETSKQQNGHDGSPRGY